MPASPPKARAIYFVVGLLAAMSAHVAKASDVLLDPTKIGVTHKAAASGDLLDPTALGATPGAKSNDGQIEPDLGGGESPETGRAEATLVVGALERLTRDLANLVHELEKLNSELDAVNSKAFRMQLDKTDIMYEYRHGEFCSGCNQTKSQILAKGEQFPHPNQHVVEATPEMIAAKERELDAAISAVEAERQPIVDKIPKVQAERDEALDQIQAGYQLWITGVSCQHVLIAAADRRSEARYQANHGKAEAQLAKLSVEFIKPGDADRLAAHQREVATWTAARERAGEQRAADQRQVKIDYYKAGRAARSDCDLLNSYFGREGVRQVLTLVAQVKILSPRAGYNAEGGMFRMGDYSPARHNQIDSSVQGFVTHFDALPSAEFRALNNFIEVGPSLPAAAPETGVIPGAQKALRDLIDALPADDDGKTKHKPLSNPGGVRG